MLSVHFVTKAHGSGCAGTVAPRGTKSGSGPRRRGAEAQRCSFRSEGRGARREARLSVSARLSQPCRAAAPAGGGRRCQ